MFQINYRSRRIFNINLSVMLFVVAAVGALIVPVVLFTTLFGSANAATNDNIVYKPGAETLLEGLNTLSKCAPATTVTTAQPGSNPVQGLYCGSELCTTNIGNPDVYCTSGGQKCAPMTATSTNLYCGSNLCGAGQNSCLDGKCIASTDTACTPTVTTTSTAKIAAVATNAAAGQNWAAHPSKNCAWAGGNACSTTHFNGCNPAEGKMCWCNGPYESDADGFLYGNSDGNHTIDCGGSCNGRSGLVMGDGTSCGNPYRCPTAPTPTPSPVPTTPAPTPAPAARCDYLDGPEGTKTGPQRLCYTAHGTFSNGAKADHVDVTFRSSNGETLSNRTTGLGGATNGVVSNQECFDVSAPGSYAFTATYYSQGGVNVQNNGGGSCSKAVTINSPTTTPTTIPPTKTVTPTPTKTATPTPTPTTVPPTTRVPQTVTMQVNAICTDNANYNLNDGNTVSFRVYDQGQATHRLDKRTPYTLVDLTPNVGLILVPNRLTIPLSNGATAILRNVASVNGTNQNMGTISPINYNNGFHLGVTPSQNTTVQFFYDHCNIPVTTTVPPTTIPPTTVPPTTVPPTTIPTQNAKCVSIVKTTQNASDICYKVTGQFNNINASKVRIFYDQEHDDSISEDKTTFVNNNMTGTVIVDNLCHTYDVSGDFKVKAQFYDQNNNIVPEQSTGVCLTSVSVSPTPTPSSSVTPTPSVTPKVLGATTTPTPALVNTGQWNTIVNIILGIVIFGIILTIRAKRNRNKNRTGENEFEKMYMSYYAQPNQATYAPVNESVEPVIDNNTDQYDLYSNSVDNQTNTVNSTIVENKVDESINPVDEKHKGRLI